MNRRDTVLALVALGAAPLATEAQRSGTPRRIGILSLGSPDVSAHLIRAFHDGMRGRGHVEGADFEIDIRWAKGSEDALKPLAAELAALKPAVIVAPGTVAVEAARKAAPEVPIVALTGELSVAGFVQNFARPESGITGVSFLASGLDAKRLELLAQLLPKGSAVLNLADSSARAGSQQQLEAAGRALGLVLHSAEARTPKEIEAAFATTRSLRAAGVNVLTSPFLNTHRARIIELAAAAKLPAIYQWPETAEEGGLMAYGPRATVIYGQLAGFVSRILRGATPANLPVEQPTRFELVINMKTAKALGIKIPESLLFRADRVIE